MDKIKNDYSTILRYFFISRLWFLFAAIAAMYIIPLRTGYTGDQVAPNIPYLGWIWANMDGRHFINIATKGYMHFDYAYFPLYPSLISIFGYLTKAPHVYLGIIISLASYFGAMVYLYKITRLDYSKKISNTTLLILSFFPVAFFYQSVYTDSLFLFLSTASFYYARKKLWLLAGLFGYLTALSRLTGTALVIGLLVEWLYQNPLPKKYDLITYKRYILNFLQTGFIATGLTSAGFASYLGYLEIKHGNLMLFKSSMSAWRQGIITNPLQVPWRYLKIFWYVEKNLVEYWIAGLELVATVTNYTFTYLVAKRIRPAYAIFMLFLFLLPAATGTFAGMPRYILHTFPAFILIAVLIEGKPRVKKFIMLIFLVLGFILCGLSTRGYFVS